MPDDIHSLQRYISARLYIKFIFKKKTTLMSIVYSLCGYSLRCFFFVFLFSYIPRNQ